MRLSRDGETLPLPRIHRAGDASAAARCGTSSAPASGREREPAGYVVAPAGRSSAVRFPRRTGCRPGRAHRQEGGAADQPAAVRTTERGDTGLQQNRGLSFWLSFWLSSCLFMSDPPSSVPPSSPSPMRP